MELIIILIVIIVLALSYVGYILFSKFSDLKNIDVESISEARQDRARAKIIEDKFFRRSSEIKNKLGKIISPQKIFLAGQLKRIKDKATRLEAKYHGEKHKKEPRLSISQLLIKAQKQANDESYDEAEKCLIEIIARDKKNIKAYELLGEIYFLDRDYNQAEEIYQYLIKLSTSKRRGGKKLNQLDISRESVEQDEMDFLKELDVDVSVAVYYDDLGEVYELQGKDQKALDAYLKANSIEPNSPKYLDKLIELSVKIGDRGLAKRTFNHLKKINPDNAKLSDMAEAIEKLK